MSIDSIRRWHCIHDPGDRAPTATRGVRVVTGIHPTTTLSSHQPTPTPIPRVIIPAAFRGWFRSSPGTDEHSSGEAGEEKRRNRGIHRTGINSQQLTPAPDSESDAAHPPQLSTHSAHHPAPLPPPWRKRQQARARDHQQMGGTPCASPSSLWNEPPVAHGPPPPLTRAARRANPSGLMASHSTFSRGITEIIDMKYQDQVSSTQFSLLT
jgi:hypothetical protein